MGPCHAGGPPVRPTLGAHACTHTPRARAVTACGGRGQPAGGGRRRPAGGAGEGVGFLTLGGMADRRRNRRRWPEPRARPRERRPARGDERGRSDRRWRRRRRRGGARRRRGTAATSSDGGDGKFGQHLPCVMAPPRASTCSGRRRAEQLYCSSVIGPGPWQRPGPMTHRSRAVATPGNNEAH